MGANLFCKKLGYESGTQQTTGGSFGEDALRIGNCKEGDSLTDCTGGCNDYQLGGKFLSCISKVADCSKGKQAKMSISCTGGSNPSKSSCEGTDMHLSFN